MDDPGILFGHVSGEVYAQRYDASGNAVGGETLSTTVNDQVNPTVAALADGGYVVTWMSYIPRRLGLRCLQSSIYWIGAAADHRRRVCFWHHR